MMCAYRTPDQSYCKFNTNYSNNILITWGEVKNNAVIPPEHGAGPSPLRAGQFQLLCQSTAGLVWLWQRAHKGPKSPWEALVTAPHPGKGGTKPSLAVSSCSLAVRHTAPLCWCLSTTKGGFVAGLSWNPGLLWPLHVFCILSRMITHLGNNYVIKEKMPFWRSNLKKCHFPSKSSTFWCLCSHLLPLNIRFSPVDFNLLLKIVLMTSFDTFSIYF